MGNRRGISGSRGSGAALYATLAAAFAVISVITAMALFFKITEITVEGVKKYSVSQIVEASGIEMDTSVFFINSSSAEIDIMTALPYVDSVKVTRRLPGTVVISVTESKPAAFVASGSKYYIIDEKGRILDETSSAPDVAELRGVTAVSPTPGKALSLGESETVRLRSAVELLKFLDGEDKLELTGWIDMTNLGSVVVEYDGYRINIGTCEGLEDKFKLINDFLAQNAGPGNGRSVIYDDKVKGLWF